MHTSSHDVSNSERPSHLITFLTVVITVSVCGRGLLADDWSHWRGPDRNDIVQRHSGWTGSEWPIGEPEWTAEVGVGCSSPCVVGQRVFTLGWLKDNEILTALDVKSGKELWSEQWAAPAYGRNAIGDQGIYRGPSGSPEYDATTGMLYTLGADGELRCWNVGRGDKTTNPEVVWRTNLNERFKIQRRPNVGPSRRMLRDYGYTSAPLVYRDWLLVEVGDSTGNLMAFDKRTGELRWKSENTDPAGHSGSPVYIEIEKVPCVVVLTIHGLVVTRLDEQNAGKTIATYKWTTDFANNIASPAVSGQSVLVSSAYNHYAMARVDFSLNGAKEVWQSKSCTGVCSPIIHDGHIYWSWRGIHCLEFETGKELWNGGRTGSAGSCVLTADHRLITFADQGELILSETAKRSPSKYTELARRKRLFRSDAWPHVVISGDQMLLKDRSGVVKAFRLPKSP